MAILEKQCYLCKHHCKDFSVLSKRRKHFKLIVYLLSRGVLSLAAVLGNRLLRPQLVTSKFGRSEVDVLIEFYCTWFRNTHTYTHKLLYAGMTYLEPFASIRLSVSFGNFFAIRTSRVRCRLKR